MMDELIFILAFKGKQDINTVYKLKWGKAKRYKEQIMEYYKIFEDTLKDISNKL